MIPCALRARDKTETKWNKKSGDQPLWIASSNKWHIHIIHHVLTLFSPQQSRLPYHIHICASSCDDTRYKVSLLIEMRLYFTIGVPRVFTRSHEESCVCTIFLSSFILLSLATRNHKLFHIEWQNSKSKAVYPRHVTSRRITEKYVLLLLTWRLMRKSGKSGKNRFIIQHSPPLANALESVS